MKTDFMRKQDSMAQWVKSKRKERPTEKQYDDYYKDKWLEAEQELEELKKAIETIVSKITIPYHEHSVS